MKPSSVIGTWSWGADHRFTCLFLVVALATNPVFALSPGSPSPDAQTPRLIALAAPNAVQQVDMPASAAEASRILGASADVARIVELSNQLKQADSEAVRTEMLALKCAVLRKIMIGYLEVRQTSGAIDVDLGYTYDAIAKGSRTRDRLTQMCNVANFTQFGVQFSMAAAFRLHGDGFMSNLLTCTGGGATLLVSSLGLLASAKAGKSKDKHPPNALADFFDLNPPMQYKLPGMLKAFINSRAPGTNLTRKQLELTLWKRYFHVDASRPEKLAAIADSATNKHGESLALLNNRLVLLYALNAMVEDFDSELIALLRYLEGTDTIPVTITDADCAAYLSTLKPEAAEAARLLDIEKQVAELSSIRSTTGSKITTHHQLRLETLLLEKVLGGALEVRKAVDRVDREKHYQIDVVMSELTGRRDRFMHNCDVANFMQTGILKSIAGICFFQGQPNAGADLLQVLTGLNVVLASASLAGSRGGKRKIDDAPNSLAQFVNLSPPPEYRLSPLMSRFINSSARNSGETRKQQLIDRWKKHGIAEMSKPVQLARLAYMPSERDKKVDNISLASARLRMLFDVRTDLENFDIGLLSLLRAIDVNPKGSADDENLTSLHAVVEDLQRSKSANKFENVEQIGEHLLVARRILMDSLDVRSAVEQIDEELVTEYTVQGEMIAKMNKRIEITNAVNFLQSGVTGLVAGGLGYKTSHAAQTAGNELDIASGSTVIVLALYSMWQARGGKRPYEAQPNMLGPIFDLKDAPDNKHFSKLVWTHLNSPATGDFANNGMTRKEWLTTHWKKDGVLTCDVTNAQTLEKLAATGPAHTQKSENLKLIKNRIYMLSELRTQVETLDAELLSIMYAIN